MGDVNEDSNHDKLIEDYLFGGYRPNSSKTTSDADQQFARPIEDEDLFGLDCRNSEPEEPSPAKLKAKQMREKIREQAIANGLVPKWSGCGADGMVEINIHHQRPTTVSKSKIIFDRLLKKSEDRKNSLYGGGKLTWDVYSSVLRKKLCADKRKVWDTFQRPTDNFDDEEEEILSTNSSPEPSEVDVQENK